MRDNICKMTSHFKCPIIWNRVRITMPFCLYDVAENLSKMKLTFQNCMSLESTKPHKHNSKRRRWILSIHGPIRGKYPSPTSDPVEPVDVRLFIPEKNLHTFSWLTSFVLFFSCRRAAQWFVTGSSRQSEAAFTPPPHILPSHTQRFALQPNISLPFLSFFFFIFSMTHDLFLFAWCRRLFFVFCFFGLENWSENSVLLGVEVLF